MARLILIHVIAATHKQWKVDDQMPVRLSLSLHAASVSNIPHWKPMMTAGHAKSVCQRASERASRSSRAGNGEISFSMALDGGGGEKEPEAESPSFSVPSKYHNVFS